MKLYTDRLFMRELKADDWRAMQRVGLDSRQSAYAAYDMALPAEDEAIQSLTARFAASGLFFTVQLQDSGEMIGYICFHEQSGSYDLGYCFLGEYQGKGYAYESCAAVMEYLEKHCDVRRFTAGTALENTPSCRLLKKLGFVLKETEMRSFHAGVTFEGGQFVKAAGQAPD